MVTQYSGEEHTFMHNYHSLSQMINDGKICYAYTLLRNHARLYLKLKYSSITLNYKHICFI